jgi:drug/metabolite transporter (DMT)-like permease
MSPALIGQLLYAGLVASALAFSVQNWGQARTTAVHAAVVFASEPVFAALYSVALGREVLGTREIGGGLLILAGVLVSEVGGALWTSPQPSG